MFDRWHQQCQVVVQACVATVRHLYCGKPLAAGIWQACVLPGLLQRLRDLSKMAYEFSVSEAQLLFYLPRYRQHRMRCAAHAGLSADAAPTPTMYI